MEATRLWPPASRPPTLNSTIESQGRVVLARRPHTLNKKLVHMIRSLASALIVAVAPAIAGQSSSVLNPLLARHDAVGRAIAYQMHATNQHGERVSRYDADASGTMVRDSAGHQIDALVWRRLVVDGVEQQLPASGAAVEQRLGFAPGFLIPPDVAHTDPRLTGPVLDLFTFYVDWWLAARSPTLQRPGDHVHVPGRGSNSWANGPAVMVAADAVDFDVTLISLDSSTHRAVIDVQHLPPDSARVRMPAEWMDGRLGIEPNNWAEVEARDGAFVAAVGRETFDDRIVIDLTNGQIVSAAMDNPVEVLEQRCTDRELKQCGAPNRYRIVRRIEVTRVSTADH